MSTEYRLPKNERLDSHRSLGFDIPSGKFDVGGEVQHITIYSEESEVPLSISAEVVGSSIRIWVGGIPPGCPLHHVL